MAGYIISLVVFLLVSMVMIIGFFVMASTIRSETVAMVLLLSGIIGSLPIMMLYHNYLKKKYYK